MTTPLAVCACGHGHLKACPHRLCGCRYPHHPHHPASRALPLLTAVEVAR